MAMSYSLGTAVALRETMLARITAGAADPTLAIYTAANTLLATVVIDPVASGIDPVTADLTLVIATQEDASPASGTAAYGVILNGDGDPEARAPCQAGSTPVAGTIVINSLTLIEGAPFEVRSCIFPGGTLIEEA
jgi:hypothetical protein